MTVVTVNLDDANVEWLDAETDNRSAFVNKLITKAREGNNDIERVVAQYQREQLERERAKLEVQLESVHDQLEAVDQRVSVAESQENAELEKSIEDLSGTPRDPTNIAIQKHAKKLGMTPEALIEELEVHE